MTIRARVLQLPAIVLGISLAVWPASAADKTATVNFKAGSSSATLSGSVKGYDGVKYLLGAAAGQRMSVKLKSSNASCYFNVTPPGSDTAVFIGSEAGNAFSCTLSATGN